MKYTPPIQQFWTFLITYGLGAIAMSLVMGFMLGPIDMLIGLAILILAFGGLSVMGQSWFLPPRPGNWQGRPIAPSDWPDQDWDLLDQYEQTLRELGFRALQDYCHARESVRPTAVVRCFWHPIAGCLAEVGLVFGPQGKPKISHTVFFSVFEQGWMLIDCNHAPDRRESLIYASHNRRESRELRRYQPYFDVAKVFESHLKASQDMVHTLNIDVLPQDSWEMYQEIQRELITQPWTRLQRQNLVTTMLRATKFEQRPQHRWQQHYAKVKAEKAINAKLTKATRKGKPAIATVNT
jgi:hypothetical protein